jgi:two-component system, OmpR family, response regulator
MPCVLIADDNRQLTEMLRASLEDAGFDVLTAYSGLAAVACVEQNDVEVAVLDVLMPGISGDAVAERLRQIIPKLPVVLMTGSDGAFAAGSGFPVLRKPFQHEELVATLNKLLADAA